MKTILVNILAILVIVGLALTMVGGTLATWSDSETSYENIETGSLDLLVARCSEDWQNCGLFNDDTPWGTGLVPCFNIPEVELDETYACYLLLWNAGCVDGVAYLHIKDVANNNLLSNNTTMDIWYDHDGNPTTPLVLVRSGPIATLACQEIELGLLPGEGYLQLKLEIISSLASAGDSLSFDIAFELVQLELYGPRAAWADSESNSSELTFTFEGCTHGAWKNHLLEIGEWVPTGFSPDQTVVSVFSEAAAYPDLNGDTVEDTLLDALNFGGGDGVEGGARILLQAAVAALLNAAHPDVNYPMPEGDVIAKVDAALASGDPDTMLDLEEILNEYNNFGGPLCD